MPGIDWKEDCLEGSGGQRNVKCMTWNAEKEKVINVICALKCEAAKVKEASEAEAHLAEIRVSKSLHFKQLRVTHQLSYVLSDSLILVDGISSVNRNIEFFLSPSRCG